MGLAAFLLSTAPVSARDFGQETYDLKRKDTWEVAPQTGLYIGSSYSMGIVLGGQASYYLTEEYAGNLRLESIFTSRASDLTAATITSVMFLGGQYHMNEISLLGPFYPYVLANLGLFFASTPPTLTGSSAGSLIEIGAGAKYYFKEKQSGVVLELRNAILSNFDVMNIKILVGYFLVEPNPFKTPAATDKK